MTIDNPWNLDPVNPTSNSSFNSINVAENCPPSNMNNMGRQLGTWLAQSTSYKSADMSSSVSTNIAAAGTGYYFDITGSNAINHLGSPAGAEQPSAAVFRILQFDSSASVSHGANIKLIGSASRRQQPGDVSGFIHEGSGVWREFISSRADGALSADSISVTTITNRSMSTSAVSTVTLNAASASVTSIAFTSLNTNSISASVGEFTLLSAGGRPAIVFHGTAVNAANTTLGTILPIDDSIPQNTEGTEVLSLTVTPTNAASILKIAFSSFVGGSANQTIGAALFIDSTAGALNATCAAIAGAGSVNTGLNLVHYVSASNTTQRVYHIRAGSSLATDAFLNGDSSSRLFGGVAAASLTVEEILP